MRIITLSLAIVTLMILGGFKPTKSLVVTSPVFDNNGMIPTKYSCLGQEASPPINVTSIPEGTKSLVLIVDDPDASFKPTAKPDGPNVTTYNVYKHAKKNTKKKPPTTVVSRQPAVVSDGCFTHWIIWNLETQGYIPENFKNDFEGMNSLEQVGYKGMCPQKGLHHYHFKVYALDTKLNIPHSSDKVALEKVMEGHILAWGDLVGTFDKNYR